MGIRVWIGEALEPSLLMSFLLVSLGTTTAVHDGFFNLTFYILAIVGVTLLAVGYLLSIVLGM